MTGRFAKPSYTSNEKRPVRPYRQAVPHLVCIYDGKPVPKVIDFGVAKATGPKLTDKTLFSSSKLDTRRAPKAADSSSASD